jgi:hypothetical protein
MNVAKVASTHLHGELGAQRRAADSNRQLANAQPGEEVNLRVLAKLADRRYVASFGDSRYIVDSNVLLSVGQMVKATVTSVGGIVELKYLGAGQFEQVTAKDPAELPEETSAAGKALAELQTKYRLSVPPQARQLVSDIGADVQRPESMAMSALYLSRMGESVESEALQALYAKQVWTDDNLQGTGGAVDISALVLGVQQGNAADVHALAKQLGDALEPAAGAAATPAAMPLGGGLQAAGTGEAALAQQDPDPSKDQPKNSLKELAHRLLNMQDAGTLAYHFGSLPVIVANQLVELDLVLFRERQSATRPDGMRKLVMTLRTETLGKVEIVAQSLDAHLSISIAAQNADSSSSLSTHAQQVRELVSRLGWNIDNVSYRVTEGPPRAAEQIVKHVLAAGSLDAVV